MTPATARALADPGTRRAVIAELRARADGDNANGDRAHQDGRYKLANANWMRAAKRIRAAQALGNGKDTDPGDHRLIEEAWGCVRDRARTKDGP